jgi:LPS export ABC transporter protein LptC
MGAAMTRLWPQHWRRVPASRGAAVVVAALAAAALVAWWRAPTGAPPPVPEAVGQPASQPPVLLEVQGSRLLGSDDAGRLRWDLDADTVQVDRSRRVVDVVRPRGRWYSGGTVAVVFQAPRGRYLADAGVIDLDGGVSAASADGRTVQARRIRWEIRQGTVQAQGDVILRQPGTVIRADRLSGDAALTTITLQGRVTIVVE